MRHSQPGLIANQAAQPNGYGDWFHRLAAVELAYGVLHSTADGCFGIGQHKQRCRLGRAPGKPRFSAVRLSIGQSGLWLQLLDVNIGDLGLKLDALPVHL
jgi:hypothetical protein